MVATSKNQNPLHRVDREGSGLGPWQDVRAVAMSWTILNPWQSAWRLEKWVAWFWVVTVREGGVEEVGEWRCG